MMYYICGNLLIFNQAEMPKMIVRTNKTPDPTGKSKVVKNSPEALRNVDN